MRRSLLTALIFGLMNSSCGMGDFQACSRWLTDPRNKDTFGRGVVVARFKESVQTETEATRIVEAESFQVGSFLLSTAPMTAFVLVPNGSECASVERLSANPSVDSVGLDIIAHAQ